MITATTATPASGMTYESGAVITGAPHINVANIDPDPTQIRTRNGFDAKSLRAFAATLERAGLLQPILLRRAPAGSAYEFEIIAGRRRFAAVMLLGWTSIPALISSANDLEAYEAQAIENLQREQLTLADTADAVRMLSHVYDTPTAIGEALGKSKAWVSKHLTLTAPTFSAETRALLDEGFTDDIELLHTMNQLHKKHMAGLDGHGFFDLVNRIRRGESCRQRARDLLAKLKAPVILADANSQGELLDDDENAATPAARPTVSFTLTADEFAQFDALGGAGWVRKQLKKART